MSNYAFGNGGHAKGHVRDAFLEAIEAFYRRRAQKPLPKVEFEDRKITIAEAAGLVWNCDDTIPRDYADMLGDRVGTYAQAARQLKRLA